MNAKRTSVTVSEMLFWTALLLAVVLLVEFDEPISAFITRHIGMLMFLIVAGSIGAAGYFLIAREPGALNRALGGLPQTWSRSLDKEPGCDLCGDALTSFECADHQLLLCAACSQRHDAHYRCNIRYVPAVHDAQERRA